jgi:hypothetical protein
LLGSRRRRFEGALSAFPVILRRNPFAAVPQRPAKDLAYLLLTPQ